MSIVIGRDLRTYESLPNQIQYLFRPTMSCTAAPTSLWMGYCHNAFAKIQRSGETTKKKEGKNEEICREGERDQILRTHRFIDSGGAIAKLLVFILSP